ncbi:hypothetical protein AK812_SmicGene18737 [Symbiodinium microadriaticum]|uniref:Uncharacterized protein n=1 Tax=Symbiodinium microadriaticum TaxID=2951 RepID=A0A1Q9DUC8_SYMMI|nr:hypothetical protein AK812_SmicGene18737 [Symbiodinium microadriaticum]CAE6964998.1 unnamed protein product [Symbiodinium sp. KB8]CAE7519994.1 unnamed protein product [Symbiodinium microadriaticum]
MMFAMKKNMMMMMMMMMKKKNMMMMMMMMMTVMMVMTMFLVIIAVPSVIAAMMRAFRREAGRRGPCEAKTARKRSALPIEVDGNGKEDCAGILPSLCHKFLQYAADNHVSTRDVKICRDDLYSLFGDEGEKTINRNGFEQLIDNVRMENQPNTIQEPENLHSLGRSLVGSRTDPLLSPVFR